MIPSSFEYFSPGSLEEALDLLSLHKEDVKLIAGGQSLLPLMKLRLAKPGCIIDLGRIPGLDAIAEQGDRIAIGALATHAKIEASALLKARCPLLPQTASTIADVQVRNRGTLGGSLAHADPAGDMPAAILALSAQMKAAGPSGERWIKAEDFFLGLMMTALEADEIITEIKTPALKNVKTAYLKAAQRTSGFAVAGIAVCLKLDDDGVCSDIAVAVTGVGDKAYRAQNVEQALKGQKPEPGLIEQAAAGVTDGIEVIEDINGSKSYRSHLARVYTVRAIETALKS